MIRKRNARPDDSGESADSRPAASDSAARPTGQQDAEHVSVGQAFISGANLQGLRQRFIARTRDDYATLIDFQRSDGLPKPEMVPVVHRLAGTAGMLGYTAISAIAGRLDDELAEGNAHANETLRELLATLEKTVSPTEEAC